MSDPTAASNSTPDPSQPADQSGRRRDCRHGGRRRRGWVLLGAALVTGLIGFGLGRASGARWHAHGHGFGMHRLLDGDTAMRRAEACIDGLLARIDGTLE